MDANNYKAISAIFFQNKIVLYLKLRVQFVIRVSNSQPEKNKSRKFFFLGLF
jgi:hypothetical protein